MDPDWARRVAASYLRAVGEPLADPRSLMDDPRVILAHEGSHDPVLVFANRAAQRLWEHDLVGMPSRLTAPPEARAERAQALAGPGVVRGYSGVRISATGRRFRILDATVWPVWDDDGTVVGQAAMFAATEPVTGGRAERPGPGGA